MFDDTFPVKFVGGSRDGETIDATHVSEYYEVCINPDFTEIYERQNEQPPFIYQQIGYAKRESWR